MKPRLTEGTRQDDPPNMGTPGTPRNENGSDIDLDLGFGGVVSSKSRRRLLNRDGTFNVRRTGMAFFGFATRPTAGNAES